MKYIFFTIAIVACIGQTLAVDCPNIPLMDFNYFNFDGVNK
jgi:hypothetical protein